jgi:hypothetical protein
MISWQTAEPTVGHVAIGTASFGQTRWLPATAAERDHRVTVSALAPASTYRAWVSSVAGGSKGQQATLDLTTPVVAGPAAATTAGGALLVDGQPWFPLMVFGACSTLYPSLLGDGISLFADNPCGGLATQLDALSGRALSAGIAGSDASTGGPGVIGTFFPDEADGRGYTGALLPSLPRPGLGLLTLTSHFYSGASPLARGRVIYPGLIARADVVGFDLYPLQGWCQRDRLADVYAAQRVLVALAAGKPTFQWIEAAGMNCPSDPTVAVTSATVRAEAWLAIAGGAHGLGFFPAAWTGDVGGAIAGVAAQIADLLPALLAPQTATTVAPSASTVRAAAWTQAGTVYVAAINSGNATASATVHIAGLGARTLTVLGENRSLTATGDTLTDTFQPLAVHIYIAPPTNN